MNFIYKILDYGIIIQTEDYCHFFDNAKNAASAAFELLQGGSTEDWDNNEPDQRVEYYTGDQDDLLKVAKTFSRNESDSLFASVFFEEVHLSFYIRGLING
tara:strand:+ start:1460 stop:1762 length:303 start_codon:yes stop_codon:yes gene_type:complete